MNKETQIYYAAKQLFEMGNVEIAESIFTSDYIAHDGDKTHKGHKFIKQFIKQLKTAITDLKIKQMEILSN